MERSLQESTTVTVEGDSWIHGSIGHSASEVERVETASEMQVQLVLLIITGRLFLITISLMCLNLIVKVEGLHIKGLNEGRAALDQRHLEALADDDTGAGSGGRATALVADRIVLDDKMTRQDSQEGGYTHSCCKQVIIPADGNEIVGTRFLVLGESIYLTSYFLSLLVR